MNLLLVLGAFGLLAIGFLAGAMYRHRRIAWAKAVYEEVKGVVLGSETHESIVYSLAPKAALQQIAAGYVFTWVNPKDLGLLLHRAQEKRQSSA
jgi:hypothetical protein